MTTTVFRLDGKIARMASDSRVSYVDNGSGHVVKVFDSPDYFKVAAINDVLYGFAGANQIYKKFLQLYSYLEADSNGVMDALVHYASKKRIEFAMLRFDGELREFAHSPNQRSGSKILLNSFSKPLKTKHYAIGSGKHSKAYKKYRVNKAVQVPIYKIISANKTALGKIEQSIAKKVGKQRFTSAESKVIFDACHANGGDIFTGGDVRIMETKSTNMSAADAAKQVQILEHLDNIADSNGAVCASPIYADIEIANLEKLGVVPVESKKDKQIENSKIYSIIND